jgi:hypothetical protein
MYKKITILVAALLLSAATNAHEWISFGNRAEGTPPESLPHDFHD